MFIVKIVLIASLVKCLVRIESPLLCAAIYSVFALGTSLIFGGANLGALADTAASFALAFSFFWALNRLEPFCLLWLLCFSFGMLGLFYCEFLVARWL